jgi:hypothetical protein
VCGADSLAVCPAPPTAGGGLSASMLCAGVMRCCRQLGFCALDFRSAPQLAVVNSCARRCVGAGACGVVATWMPMPQSTHSSDYAIYDLWLKHRQLNMLIAHTISLHDTAVAGGACLLHKCASSATRASLVTFWALRSVNSRMGPPRQKRTPRARSRTRDARSHARQAPTPSCVVTGAAGRMHHQ